MRRTLIWLVGGAVLIAVGLLLVSGRGISAVGHRPLPFEARLARGSWRLLVPKETRNASNPVPDGAVTLKGAREHWADHCATCHDNDGSGETTIGRRTYPPAPDLRGEATQRLTDGELFYAIEQGIPWTAMPGWRTGTADGERQTWALVRFVRHLPSITTEELHEMERLNPKPPVNEEQEKEIEDFLNGPAPVTRGGRSRTP